MVDSGWASAGFSAEIMASVVEKLPVNALKNSPVRIALPNAPAPTSRILEKEYFFTAETVVNAAKKII